MGEVEYWVLAAIAFGVISAGFYTWLSSGPIYLLHEEQTHHLMSECHP